MAHASSSSDMVTMTPQTTTMTIYKAPTQSPKRNKKRKAEDEAEADDEDEDEYDDEDEDEDEDEDCHNAFMCGYLNGLAGCPPNKESMTMYLNKKMLRDENKYLKAENGTLKHTMQALIAVNIDKELRLDALKGAMNALIAADSSKPTAAMHNP
jgi:ABC-type Zn2+ transport system substrate-binding protein/surface adhesin